MRQSSLLSALLLIVPISLSAASSTYSVRMLPLPSGVPGGIYMDYLA